MPLWTESEWESFWKENRPIEWNTNKVDTNLIEYFPKGISTALEIGCGSGVNSQWMHSMGAKTTAMDISLSAVEYAKEHYPGPTYLHQNIIEKPPEGTYDILIS